MRGSSCNTINFAEVKGDHMIYESQSGDLNLVAGGDTMITRKFRVFKEILLVFSMFSSIF